MADPLATLHPDVQREISTLLETFRTKQRAEAPENLAEILKGVVQDPIVAILEREANLLGNTPQATALRALAFGMRSPANALSLSLDYIKARNKGLDQGPALALAGTKFAIGAAAGLAAGELAAVVTALFTSNPWAIMFIAIAAGTAAGIGMNELFGKRLDDLFVENFSDAGKIAGMIGYARKAWPADDQRFVDDYVASRLNELIKGKTKNEDLAAAVIQVENELTAWATYHRVSEEKRRELEQNDPTFVRDVEAARERLIRNPPADPSIGDFPYDPSVTYAQAFPNLNIADDLAGIHQAVSSGGLQSGVHYQFGEAELVRESDGQLWLRSATSPFDLAFNSGFIRVVVHSDPGTLLSDFTEGLEGLDPKHGGLIFEIPDDAGGVVRYVVIKLAGMLVSAEYVVDANGRESLRTVDVEDGISSAAFVAGTILELGLDSTELALLADDSIALESPGSDIIASNRAQLLSAIVRGVDSIGATLGGSIGAALNSIWSGDTIAMALATRAISTGIVPSARQASEDGEQIQFTLRFVGRDLLRSKHVGDDRTTKLERRDLLAIVFDGFTELNLHSGTGHRKPFRVAARTLMRRATGLPDNDGLSKGTDSLSIVLAPVPYYPHGCGRAR